EEASRHETESGQEEGYRQAQACGAPGTQDGCGTCCVILINSPGSLRVKARHPAHPGWRAFRFQGTMLSCTTFPQ
ncbi:MAG: hypothetical protein WAR81_09005, partial [Pseudomonadales bacterium]